MKSTLAIAGILAVSACAQAPDVISLDDIRDARGDMPGFNAVINCSAAPRYIFDKHGEIVETVHPIRHPSCKDDDARQARRHNDDNRFARLEATDDDVPPVTVPVDLPTTTVLPEDIDLGCDGRLHCEPDSKTQPIAYKLWLKRAKERAKNRSASALY